MKSIWIKEVEGYFSSLIGYLVIGVFLVTIGLFMWVFSDTSVLDYNFASMDQLFSIAPLIFLFLIPAVTMRSFAEEKQSGTLELLFTKPVSSIDIIVGKYLAYFFLVIAAMLPSLIYVFSIYQLGAPKGNLDIGGIIGSYIGLILLASVFVSIGIFSSCLSQNQISSFILAAFLCFIIHWSFTYIARLPIFAAGADFYINQLGLNHHYSNISKGLVETKDIIYFGSMTFLFLYLSHTVLTLKYK